MTEKNQKRIKIFTNGCFDLLHPGHFFLITRIRELFPVEYAKLIVGLNADSSVRQLKGSDRPFYDHTLRKFMLENIKGVDEVVVFEDKTPINLIKDIRPDIVIKGSDYNGKEVVGSDIADILLIRLYDGFSTTDIIDKIKKGERL